jgi:hypothetical protein
MNGYPLNAPQNDHPIEKISFFAPRQVGTCFE